MSTQLLCHLSQASLPVTVLGCDVAGVEALAHAGLVIASIYRESWERGAGHAVVHAITSMGLRHALAFGTPRRSTFQAPPASSRSMPS